MQPPLDKLKAGNEKFVAGHLYIPMNHSIESES